MSEKRKVTEKAMLKKNSDDSQADAFEGESEVFKPPFNGEDIFSDSSKTK